MRNVSIGLTLLLAPGVAPAQVLDPFYAGDYTLTDHGSVPGVPTPYGGLTFDPADHNRLLIGGSANTLNADIYEIRVARDASGAMSGFVCGASVSFADAYGETGGIDGGLTFGPGGVLFYTSYRDNLVGQIRPGSTAPDRLVALTPLGVFPSVGALMIVPPGFAGAGRLKLASYNAWRWYDATLTPDGSGTYDIAVSPGWITGTTAPEGIVYVRGGNPGFAADSVLVSEYGAGRVSSFEIDANGDPTAATRRTFVSELAGAEGAAIDPATGDFLFSTFGGSNRVIRVSGFSAFPTCAGDLNGDSTVSIEDLAILLGSFGMEGAGDLNGNCLVDLADLAQLLANFGTICP